MPKLFAIFHGIIIGYLNGAGFGALAIDLLSSHHANDFDVVIVAAIVTGPFGALVGSLAALFDDGNSEQKSLQSH
ncbi:hypothetical protein LG047_13265 [Methylocystis sp. WRRC1]|uniref:hypothetical protein n=1 Tax=Methylocystis sp. WRRC1 TaxID=1732014 RepID=UPI001D14E431|nr:hypothetical protein [Methylocystis sp. WRRC1]MCC3246277.1 hypothetical protein [Methylocystis sp. WRRC1]